MYRKIIVASDGSGPAIKAAKVGAELASAFGSSLTVVTVAYMPRAYAGDVGSEMQEAYVEEWQRVLDDTAEVAKELGKDPQRLLLRGDNPTAALLDEIRRGSYDLVIVGRTGAGSKGLDVMGGVSRKIAEAAPCSVLIVQ